MHLSHVLIRQDYSVHEILKDQAIPLDRPFVRLTITNRRDRDVVDEPAKAGARICGEFRDEALHRTRGVTRGKLLRLPGFSLPKPKALPTRPSPSAFLFPKPMALPIAVSGLDTALETFRPMKAAFSAMAVPLEIRGSRFTTMSCTTTHSGSVVDKRNSIVKRGYESWSGL